MASVGTTALAQQDEAEPRLFLKVEVTGSHIPRSEVESALPVQVLSREDIERSGATTVAELMSKVSANVLGRNDQLSIGDSGAPGISTVNLRAIGAGNTLVLLNGRRVANYAFDGAAVDVNSIPIAALERVEVLKDGASAIYGTDAVAGVVNFILRKDFRGVEVSGHGSWPQQGGGGEQFQATLTAGAGDLSKDGYNAFVTAAWQKDNALPASARAFASSSYLPDEGINRLNPLTFPANLLFPEDFSVARLYNPTLAQGCAPPSSIPTFFPFFSSAGCGFDVLPLLDLIPPVERAHVYGRATWRANPDLTLFAEAAYASQRTSLKIAPTPAISIDPVPFLYPAGGPYYPTEFAIANGISGDLNLFYRTVALGARTNEVDASAWRVVLGAEGVASGWDYATAFNYSRSEQSDSYASGYVSESRLRSALSTGLVNPFGPSGPEGDALLAATQVSGEIRSARGSTYSFDVRASKDMTKLPGGALAIALGAEWRRETLDDVVSDFISGSDIVGSGGDQQSRSGSRNVQALFVEASLPIASGFQAQLAARYDHYSDFGSTINPKVALRWQPSKPVLLRASWGSGFRAPPLYDLFSPHSHYYTDDSEDPLRCPVTGAAVDCRGSFLVRLGGNPELQPETSEQFNAGIVWEPVAGVSLAVDYWKIDKDGVIGQLTPEQILGNWDVYGPARVLRGPPDPAHPDLAGPIETIYTLNENLGNLETSGVDVDVRWRGPATAIGRFGFSLNGTYLIDWKFQADAVNYYRGVGLAQFGPIPRWKHYASLDWERGPWGATLAHNYQTGYRDVNTDAFGNPLPVPPRRVSSYETWDLQGRYAGWTNTTVVLGVKNLLDRDPPFTNNPYNFQFGYEPWYADPRGRTWYLRLKYAFK